MQQTSCMWHYSPRLLLNLNYSQALHDIYGRILKAKGSHKYKLFLNLRNNFLFKNRTIFIIFFAFNLGFGIIGNFPIHIKTDCFRLLSLMSVDQQSPAEKITIVLENSRANIC